MKKILVAIITLSYAFNSYATPVSDALGRAKNVKSPFGVLAIPNSSLVSSAPVYINDFNNLNEAVGFDNQSEISSSSGSPTGIYFGDGFILSATGEKTSMKNYAGLNFIPQVINDSGLIAGVKFDLATPTPLIPVIFSKITGLESIDGLPAGYDALTIKDINSNGSILLTLNILATPANSQIGEHYKMYTYVAKRGANNRYLATLLPLPELVTSSSRSYTPLKNPVPQNYNLYPTISGLLSQFVTPSDEVIGDTFRAGGFLYSVNLGTNYLFPGTGPVSEEIPFILIGSIPVALSLNQTFITQNTLVGIQTHSELVDYQPYNVTLTTASSDGRAAGTTSNGTYQGIMLEKTGILRNIDCSLPNSLRVSGLTPSFINSNGALIALGTDADSGNSNQYLLTPNSEGVYNNYCANISYRYLGKCGGKDQYGSIRIKKNSTCTLQVTLKDSANKGIAKSGVLLKNSAGKTVAKGTTDNKGKILLKHKLYNDGSFIIFAPYGSQKYKNSSADVYVNVF